MAKSITEQIENLQHENERLREFEKLFEKALKNEFGIGKKAITKLIKNTSENTSDFEIKICDFFELKTDEDKAAFLSIMCSDSSRRYFNDKRDN